MLNNKDDQLSLEKMLISYGANINQKDAFGNPAFYYLVLDEYCKPKTIDPMITIQQLIQNY